jgi:hypothetical protein
LLPTHIKVCRHYFLTCVAMLSVIVLFCVFVVFVVLLFKFNSQRRKLPPGPVPLPLFGNSVTLLRAGNKLVEKLLEWGDKYGPVYTIWLGSMPAVFVVDFDIMQEAFVKNADAYTGRMRNYAIEHLRGKR